MDNDPTAPLPDEELAAIDRWTPIHSSACAAQDDDAECICGTSEVYRILLALRAERTAPLDVERLARALAYGVDRQLGPGSAIAFDVAIGAAVVEYARLAPATGEGLRLDPPDGFYESPEHFVQTIPTATDEGPTDRTKEAFAAGRLVGFEEGMASCPTATDEGLRLDPPDGFYESPEHFVRTTPTAPLPDEELAAIEHAANAILDRPNADPDDDAAVCARAALRLRAERAARDGRVLRVTEEPDAWAALMAEARAFEAWYDEKLGVNAWVGVDTKTGLYGGWSADGDTIYDWDEAEMMTASGDTPEAVITQLIDIARDYRKRRDDERASDD